MNARFTKALLGGAALVLAATGAQAQDKLKVGLVTTLSGPAASLGQQVRDGFMLALKENGGKLGGREVETFVIDDELKPDVAVTKVRGMLDKEDPDFVVGTVFSNVLQAIFKPVTDGRAILISPNAGPSSYAGKACSPNFFVTSYQNDQVHEVLGKVAQDRGYKRVVLMTPNYQAGRDAMAGFKRHFKGEVLDEVYVPLGQLDYQAELTRVATEKPDAIFAFMPGGMGVNLVRQFKQAGLAETVPFLSAFTVDESTLPAQKDAAVGLYGGMTWAPNTDTPGNKAFVKSYEAAYGSVPGSYAMQAFDAAMLIDGALKKTGGSAKDKDSLRAALKSAPFTSLRGKFAFNNNGYPVQDFYLVKVAKRADGNFQTEIADKVFADYGDPYAKDCPLK